jgi:PLAT/LH2 domain
VELGAITKIVIGHDGNSLTCMFRAKLCLGAGFGAGWFLEKVVVKSESLAKEWFFLCGRWLDANQDDGKVLPRTSCCDE